MRKNDNNPNRNNHDEAAKELAKNLKSMKKPCDEKSPKFKRCLAGGFTFAYALGMIGTTLAGCNNETVIPEEYKNIISMENTVAEQNPTLFKEDTQISNTETEDDKNMNNQDEKRILIAEELPDIHYNKAKRAVESVKTQLGEEAYQNIIDNLGTTENVRNQGEYIANVIEEVKNCDGDEAATKVMRSCGYQCIDKHILTNAKKLYSESADMEEFLQKLSISLGGSNLTFKDNKIIAIYDQCFCDINDSEKKLNRCYCQCSCGWYEKLFSTVLDAPVNVELIQSIKGDADHCQFEITY